MAAWRSVCGRTWRGGWLRQADNGVYIDMVKPSTETVQRIYRQRLTRLLFNDEIESQLWRKLGLKYSVRPEFVRVVADDYKGHRLELWSVAGEFSNILYGVELSGDMVAGCWEWQIKNAIAWENKYKGW